mmetsp:Transcript_68872/g.194383  ORF Transcript_68872/g.194383 Transcript_68872/m.194383 type:complete len:89 (+) Transcript_68872:3-269(+)
MRHPVAAFFEQFPTVFEQTKRQPAAPVEPLPLPAPRASDAWEAMPPPALPPRRLRSGRAWSDVAPTVATPPTPQARGVEMEMDEDEDE